MPENCTARGGDTDDFVLFRPRANFLADRIAAGEKLICDIRADNADRRPMIFVHIREQAAGGNSDVTDPGIARRSADNGHIFTKLVSVADIGDGLHHSGNIRGQRHSRPQGIEIGDIDRRALASLRPLLHVCDDADSINDIGICAKVSHFIGDVEIEAIQYGHHCDES